MTGTVAGAPGVAAGRPGRAQPPVAFGVPAAWWPIAFASEIVSAPVAVRIGGAQLAAYRDGAGSVRVVEDRCPHRRMRLSMGRITAEGHLQCPYHGWTFDGATGQCVAIPNLRADEAVPARVRIARIHVAEPGREDPVVLGELDGELASTTLVAADVSAGLVFVWTGTADPDSSPRELATSWDVSPRAVLERRLVARAPSRRVAAALALNPGRALGLGLLVGSGDEVVGSRYGVHDGRLRIERERILFDLPRVNSYDALLRRSVPARTESCLTTGLSEISATDIAGAPQTRIVVALTPLGAYRTAVRVRIECFTRASAIKARLALAGAALCRVVGRDRVGIEELSDEVEEAVDGAIIALRAHQGGRDDDDH